MDGPLAGITVREASRDVGVRYCGRLFARLGAQVARAPGGYDSRLGHSGGAGETYGRWLDQGKIDNVSPGACVDLVILGQDPDAVSAQAQGAQEALQLAITWFGAEGPYAAWRGTDEIVLALSGVAYGFGERDGPPMLAQGHAPQITAGLTAFNAGLAALMACPRPRRVDVSILEAFLCLTETGALTTRVDGVRATRLGVNRFSPTYPCSSFETADGWVGVTALTPAQWASLCSLIGRPELGAEPRFATSYQRLMLADEVDALLKPAFRRRTTAEWVSLGAAHRIPTAPMPTPLELPHQPHWRARDAFASFDDSALTAPTLPFRTAFGGGHPRPFQGGGPAAPLAGLTVIDFSMGWAGPLCTRTLGDLGAQVIKVESEAHPDWWRGWETDPGGDPPPRETRHNFIDVNRNKLGVALDLTSAEGLAHAKALVAEADVVVENYAAGVLAKLGLGQDVQQVLNPGVISISMPAFGNGGPLSGLRAYGSTVEQASGLPFVNGESHWPPALQHVAFGDPIAGLFAAAAVLSALHGRGRLGGAQIDLAQVACLFQYGADSQIAWQLAGGPVARTGLLRRRLDLVAVAPAAGEDAWLAVAADSAQALAALGAVTGLPDDPQTGLADWARGRDAADAAHELQRRGVPAAPVQRTDALTQDPHLSAAGFWAPMDRRYVGRHLVSASPFRIDGARPALRRPAPTLGEHTDEVLAGRQ